MNIVVGAIVALQIASQTMLTADTLLASADTLSAVQMEARARMDPAAFREAVRGALRASFATGSADARDASLRRARILAEAHAAAWDDAFLLRQVEAFRRGSDDWRRMKLAADSLRRAGGLAFAEGGGPAAIPLWRESLRLAGEVGDTASMAATLYNLGANVFLSESVLDSAEVYLLQARRFARASGDLQMEGNALGVLHFVSVDRGDPVAAREHLSQAMAVRQRTGDTRGEAADLNSRGLLAWDLGDLPGARRDFEQALGLNRREGHIDVAATNLTNLATLAAVDGDFPRALSLYREALEAYRSRDMEPDAAGVLWGLGRLELRRGDYPSARAAFVEALEIFERTGPMLDAAEVRLDIARTLGAMGEIQGALDQLRRADEATGVDAPATIRAGAALARADFYVSLNLLADAEGAYSAAEALFAEAGDATGQAEARQGQALLLIEREEYTRAEAMLAGAAVVQTANNDPRGAAISRIFLARAMTGRGDLQGARTLLTRSADELADLGDPVAEAFALGELAALEAERGLAATADSLYVTALNRLGDRPAPEVRWRLHLGRGLSARARRSLDVAARELRLAVDEVDRAAESLVLVERRSAYRTDKLEAYAQLVLTERMRGRTAAAFDASERLRARESLELLSRGRTSSPSGIAGDLLAREHDLRVRLAELARAAEPTDGTTLALRGPPPSDPTATRESLSLARAAYADILLEMRERSPSEADLVRPSAADWRDVARRLTRGTTMIEYLLTDSGSLAFVVTADTLAVVDLGASRRDLARLVEFARGLVTEPTSASDSRWRGPLLRLHDFLIRPIEEARLISDTERLVVVPHAELHYLPFAALLDADGRFLVERYALGFAPSASVWLALGDRPSRAAGRGMLALAPRTASLPGTEREVAALARLGGDEVTVLRGSQASEESFTRSAGEYRVLHLATYGVLNTHNPLFSFVDLSPGGDDDGRLEVHEVFGLELAAELVVLSACQTAVGSGALGDVPAGDDWVGLTRAFLQAGAARVVATLWAVQDQSTATLMESFHERRGASDDMTALAEAQRGLIRDPRTAHPFHWAGMVLVGQQEGADAER